MELSYQEDSNSKSSSEEIDHHEIGTGRSYECVFCKRGFTTAQALGGHMNIHRKDRVNNKTTKIAPSSSSKVDLGFYSGIPIGGYHQYQYHHHHHHHHEVDSLNYHQIYNNLSYGSSGNYRASSQHVQYNSEVLCVENQRDNQFLFEQDWRKSSLSLYADNPYENNKDKLQNNTQEDHLDLELRLGYNP